MISSTNPKSSLGSLTLIVHNNRVNVWRIIQSSDGFKSLLAISQCTMRFCIVVFSRFFVYGLFLLLALEYLIIEPFISRPAIKALTVSSSSGDSSLM